jgi:hypothetical protein
MRQLPGYGARLSQFAVRVVSGTPSFFALFALACSGSDSPQGTPPDQGSARNSAAAASCDKAAACNAIGAGRVYESRDQCDVRQKATWDALWDAKTCDGHIDPAQYSLCISSIYASECGNGLDLANVLLNKCPANKVCSK